MKGGYLSPLSLGEQKMPRSDDQIEQARSQFVEKPVGSVSDNIKGLAKKYTNKYLPVIGPAIEYFQSKEQKEKQEAFNDLVLDLLAAQGKTVIEEIIERIKSGESIQVVALAVERIFWGASEKKVRRFAAVVADELSRTPDSQKTEDAVFFIRALDELSEDDVRILKHLYNHQKSRVVEHQAMDYNSFFQNNEMRKMIEEAASLGVQMDEFYARCSRLSGYGLALPLDKSHGSMGNPDIFAFRMTLLGKRLVDILVNIGGETTEVKSSKNS